jgi:hypothetical protein
MSTATVQRTELISNIQGATRMGGARRGLLSYGLRRPRRRTFRLLGVSIFFGISGFIMTHITRASADGFMTARLIRILPLYRIATIAMLIWKGCGFANPFYAVPAWSPSVTVPIILGKGSWPWTTGCPRSSSLR